MYISLTIITNSLHISFQLLNTIIFYLILTYLTTIFNREKHRSRYQFSWIVSIIISSSGSNVVVVNVTVNSLNVYIFKRYLKKKWKLSHTL